MMARTNVELDDKLVKEGLTLTSCKTKKELLNLALQELVKRKTRKGLLKFMGSNCWSGDLDKMRRSRF